MKILHTADWHLGHQLHGHDRRFEHDAFLDWLADTIKTRAIDALLVAGDLFDTANPSASAWQQLYRFLARLRAEHPALEMVLIGGNHDSPPSWMPPRAAARLRPASGGQHQPGRGGAPRDRAPAGAAARQNGEVAAWCAAVPFLRSSDLRPDGLSEGRTDSSKGYARSMRRY